MKMWDVKGGAAVATLHGHKGSVSSVAWNDNGNWLLTAGRDAVLKVLPVCCGCCAQTAMQATCHCWTPGTSVSHSDWSAAHTYHACTW